MSDSCDWNLTIPPGPQHVGFHVNFQTNCAVRACWLWDIYKDGRRKRSGSEVRFADAWDAAGKAVADMLKIEPLPAYTYNAKEPLLAGALAQQTETQRAAERIQQAQYCAAVEARAQHREVDRVQPESHLTPADEAANHKAELDRLVTPERIGAKQ